MHMRLSVVKQSFFGPPGQYGRFVTRANSSFSISFSVDAYAHLNYEKTED